MQRRLAVLRGAIKSINAQVISFDYFRGENPRLDNISQNITDILDKYGCRSPCLDSEEGRHSEIESEINTYLLSGLHHTDSDGVSAKKNLNDTRFDEIRRHSSALEEIKLQILAFGVFARDSTALELFIYIIDSIIDKSSSAYSSELSSSAHYFSSQQGYHGGSRPRTVPRTSDSSNYSVDNSGPGQETNLESRSRCQGQSEEGQGSGHSHVCPTDDGHDHDQHHHHHCPHAGNGNGNCHGSPSHYTHRVLCHGHETAQNENERQEQDPRHSDSTFNELYEVENLYPVTHRPHLDSRNSVNANVFQNEREDTSVETSARPQSQGCRHQHAQISVAGGSGTPRTVTVTSAKPHRFQITSSLQHHRENSKGSKKSNKRKSKP